MGIPRLKGHLLRYEEAVWLGQSAAPQTQGNTRNVTSVVIDGPALVYHVYYCIMATMEQHLNPFSAQPSSNEVSVGVMKMLLHLRSIGVNVEKIYFDGALPAFKRKTRIERMGKLASKLQQACLAKEHGFKGGTVRRGQARLDTEIFFSRRLMNPKFYTLPDNPLMVATVAEDLKYRWDWESIKPYYSSDSLGENSGPVGFLWANITEVVLGEADVFCAEIARERGSAVLTGDSDLVVHDLGPNGSVVFLDSIEKYDIVDTNDGLPSFGVRATETRPANIAHNLGVKSLLRVGYELKQNPYLKWSKVAELCKAADEKQEMTSSYDEFLNEYNARPYWMPESDGNGFPLLDSKVSELVAQYHLPSFNADGDELYYYLPVMVEKHGRRCAWAEGGDIRAIAYSIYNLSFSKGERRAAVLEYARRGQRIVPTPVSLLSEEALASPVEELLVQLQSAQFPVRGANVYYWVLFALLRIYAGLEHSQLPKPRAMANFFKVGHAGEMLQWDDIHLRAQILCTLYSLRMLKQFLQVSLLKGGPEVQRLGKPLLEILSSLPTLSTLSDAGINSSSAKEEDKKHVAHVINTIFERLGNGKQVLIPETEQGDQPTPKEMGNPIHIMNSMQSHAPNNKKRKRAKRTTIPPSTAHRRPEHNKNIYEILQSACDAQP
ncbi:hypothetical protein MaudCBS49596_006708 [Microsporum audouinii]